MHEVGIANEILRAGQIEAARRPGARLVAVKVRIGVLAGVDNDALRFAWEVLSQPAEGIAPRLDIEIVPRRNCCEACGAKFFSDVLGEDCPDCSSRNSRLCGGDELQLASVEVEE